MRLAMLVLALLIVPAEAVGQEAPAGAGAEPAASPEAQPAASPEAEPAASPEAEPAAPVARPKIALVVVGDPDPVLQAAALEIEAQLAVDRTARMPADAALRAALRGEAGAPDDGLDEVRRERRRLGLGETSDAPLLARLGRRAGAVLVVAVREASAGPEAIALDVRTGQYFEGALPLAEPNPAEITAFVGRRARAAARGAIAAEPPPAAPPAPEVPAAATEVAPAAQGDEPDWFEQNWPYFAAGGLLAAAIAFVVVTATDDSGDAPPMLRFQPGAP